MKPKPNFRDPAPGTGVYEGDLKYGRCESTTFKNGKDFTANRTESGAENKPVFTLPMAHKRDPAVWTGKNKHSKVINPPQLADEVLVAAFKYPRGLASSVSNMQLGNTILSERARN